MITSALGFAHGSVAKVLASSHAMLGTVTTKDPPAALAHTGGTIWLHAQSSLGQSSGWIAWLGLGSGSGFELGLGAGAGAGAGAGLGFQSWGVGRLGLDAEVVHEFRQRGARQHVCP